MDQPPFIGERISTRSPSASRQLSRSLAGTTSPFSAVASQLPWKSSSISNAASVSAATSWLWPLTVSFKGKLLCCTVSQDDVGCPPRHGRREQEAMAVEAIDANAPPVALDARQVVGKSGAYAHARFDQLGFAESRMQRVGSAEQLHGRAHGDWDRGIGLDHRRTDHEEVFRARHDIDRDARMKQSHR